MSRSKTFITAATKENISLAKEVFKERRLDYSVMPCYLFRHGL